MKTKRYKRAHCKDGFSMSVQAHAGAYCNPRNNTAKIYKEVEVGYPNQMEPLLQQYCEDPSRPCNTVYGYVPVSLVSLVITKHGGLVDGEVPNGVFLYDKLSKEVKI
jgi:hypothetical protein